MTTPLTTQFLNEVRARLEAERRTLGDAIADGPPDDVEPDIGASLLSTYEQQLAETDTALTQLDDDTYGTCTQCHQPIGLARLEAIPAASTCVTCAALPAARTLFG